MDVKSMKKRYLLLIFIFSLYLLSIVSAENTTNINNDSSELIIQNNSYSELNNSYDITNNSVNNENLSNEKVFSSKVISKNITSTYGKKVKYTIKVFDNFGKARNNTLITFKINNKIYNHCTDSNGVVSFYLNNVAGKHIIKYSIDNLTGSNTYIVKNYQKLTILKWSKGTNIAKIKLLKKNIPNNPLVKKVIKATKKGIPLLMIKGGQGKVVFITAGVHGNELSSQVAAMKMIAHLDKNPINGTVYIIPFVNTKAIEYKSRTYKKVDFNRVAAKSGTVSNKIVQLIVKYKCDSYGDFHTTQPHGIPGKNIVMGSKSPTLKSADLTKYIAKNCKVNKKIYPYASKKYPGALVANVNKKGISSVICEVMLPHNKVTKKTVNLSFSMMKSLLRFNSIMN